MSYVPAMCWRQLSKFQKTSMIVLFYLLLYLLVSYAITPEATVTFVSDELRVGDKYAVMFLVTPGMPVFTDSEGADVFSGRRCKRCFITNNRGFLPMSEYDAVLVFGERSLLTQTAAFMDPDKRYLIETSKRCVRRKLSGCVREPVITSFSSREKYDLCGLCDRLHEARKRNL